VGRELWLHRGVREVLTPMLFPCRTAGMGRRGVSQGPMPSSEGLKVTSPRQAAVLPPDPPSLRAATV
jgi:hypothetical protein